MSVRERRLNRQLNASIDPYSAETRALLEQWRDEMARQERAADRRAEMWEYLRPVVWTISLFAVFLLGGLVQWLTGDGIVGWPMP